MGAGPSVLVPRRVTCCFNAEADGVSDHSACFQLVVGLELRSGLGLGLGPGLELGIESGSGLGVVVELAL